MTSLDKLRSNHEAAEAKLQKLGAEYDDGKQKLKDRYAPQLEKASADAAAAQKALCDAEAAEALVGRPDAERLADTLGLTLPE